MQRRHLLTLAPSAVLALAACGTLSDQQAERLQSLISGAQALQMQVVPVVGVLLPLIPIGSGDSARVQQAVGALTKATTALAGVATVQAGMSYVQAIETALNTIVAVAATLPVIPPPWHQVLVAAALALPPLETLVGVAVQEGTALARTIKARAITKVAAAPAGG